MWDYLCPKCKKEVDKNSHKCPHCREQYGIPVRVPPKVLKDKKVLEEYVHREIFPRIACWQREYLTQFFTEIFSDGFESGDFTAWTGTAGTPTIVTTPVHHGTYAAQLQAGEGVNKFVYKDLGATYQTLYARLYWRISVLPAVNKFVDLIDLTAGQGAYSAVADVGYGQVSGVFNWYYRLLGNYYQGYVETISVDTWYCIELKCLVSATIGEIRVWINGVERITQTGLNTGSTNLGRMYAMFYQAPWATNAFADCVVVADTYIGPEPAANVYMVFLGKP